MSDTAQGPGWWIASDGKWYAPERHPDALKPPPAVVMEPIPVSQPSGFDPFAVQEESATRAQASLQAAREQAAREEKADAYRWPSVEPPSAGKDSLWASGRRLKWAAIGGVVLLVIVVVALIASSLGGGTKAGPAQRSSGTDLSAQTDLDTAFAYAESFYPNAGDSYTDMGPKINGLVVAGASRVDLQGLPASAASDGPNQVSVYAGGQLAIFTSYAPNTGDCLAIVSLASSERLDGNDGPATLYVIQKGGSQAQCKATHFDQTSVPANSDLNIGSWTPFS